MPVRAGRKAFQRCRTAALAGVSGLALAGLPTPAWAQDAPPADQEAPGPQTETEAGTPDGEDSETVIVVSGFRQSLQTAQAIKRNADTVVDVISAEDIGALPDRSVAEALQRVPGINVSRFAGADDPDRFSVEGSGVIIRGLPFVRSELNGRDIFSANGGTALSFNEVSPELLGRVEVYKNNTADMIEGGISGTVNLVTRKPLGSPGVKLAGTIEGNYGDLAKEWSPGFSILGSATYENEAGRIGVQLGFAHQELVTRTDASQLTDPCYRPDTLATGCQRIVPVGSGGFSGAPLFNETNFPPAGSSLVPKGAGVRTTDLTRDRDAFSAVLQYESPDGDFLVTGEYLRAEVGGTLNEYAILALVNDDNLFPTSAPGSTFTFNDDRIFQSGRLTLAQGGGIPTEFLRFQREEEAQTDDVSLDVDWSITDRLRLNAEYQSISSDRNEDGVIVAMQSQSDILIDASGKTPQVTFLPPTGSGRGGDFFTDPAQSYYWFAIDNQVRNEGELDSYRADLEYDLSETGFLRSARFGARWAERTRVTRNGNFANWGNLSAPWAGRAIFASDRPQYSSVRDPFAQFQRGAAPVPVPGGAGLYFGGDNLVDEYRAGVTEQQALDIQRTGGTFVPWVPLYRRGGLVAGTPFTAPEISDVGEETLSFYGRVDFGSDDVFGRGWTLAGNIGVRWVDTTIRSAGLIGFPTSDNFARNAQGAIDLAATCARPVVPPAVTPGFCLLSPARQAEFLSVFDDGALIDDADITFDNWLPSFNARLDFGNGMLLRAAVSKSISRPDLALYRTGGALFDNTNTLRQEGTLATGPLFAINTGNRLLTATESWNYDLSFEWYFDDVGSITLAGFVKELSGIVSSGATIRNLTSEDGDSVDVRVDGPDNTLGGTLKGFELAYQQTYDFLPGLLGGFGSQLTYTYVDAGDFSNPDLQNNRSLLAAGLPLAGVSEHTVNAVLFYERGPLQARAAYNWRSAFLQTPRDVIFPFSPIYGEATGQLDASIFFDVTESVKIGVLGVNLLDEVTRTSQLVDFDGTRVTRSAFRNDRRYTVTARFNF